VTNRHPPIIDRFDPVVRTRARIATMTDQVLQDTHGVKDKVIIVTGAGQGIGRGIAHHLAKHGAVVVAAEYKRDRLDTILHELETRRSHLGVDCDVGDRIRLRDGRQRHRRLRARGRHRQQRAVVPSVTPLEDVTQRDMDIPIARPRRRCGRYRPCSHMKAQAGDASSMGSANGIAALRRATRIEEAIRSPHRGAMGPLQHHRQLLLPRRCRASGTADTDPDDPRLGLRDHVQAPPLGDGDPEDDIVRRFFLCPTHAAGSPANFMLDGGGYMTA
jgi:hypothetical protein